ncbi:MAG: SRPBCC domain-containing protein [Bacteroidota bacterium]
MENEAFIIERIYNAPVEKVWKAISDKDEMKKWYFDLPQFKAEVGNDFQFTGGHEGGIQYRHLCKVTEVEKNKRLTYSWRYDGYEGNSFVTFELIAEGTTTRLKLTHVGLETFPQNNPDFAAKNFAEGWIHFIETALPNYFQN